jgi:hypothetical protein
MMRIERMRERTRGFIEESIGTCYHGACLDCNNRGKLFPSGKHICTACQFHQADWDLPDKSRMDVSNWVTFIEEEEMTI